MAVCSVRLVARFYPGLGSSSILDFHHSIPLTLLWPGSEIAGAKSSCTFHAVSCCSAALATNQYPAHLWFTSCAVPPPFPGSPLALSALSTLHTLSGQPFTSMASGFCNLLLINLYLSLTLYPSLQNHLRNCLGDTSTWRPTVMHASAHPRPAGLTALLASCFSPPCFPNIPPSTSNLPALFLTLSHFHSDPHLSLIRVSSNYLLCIQ